MAQKERDPLSDLERLRQSLETNVRKLRSSLQHWQTWEAEYEGLKEELEAFEHEPSSDEILKAGRELEGDLLNAKEVDDILGISKNSPRNKSQILSILVNRIRYVAQNVSTVSKQLEAAEDKLAKTMILQQPDNETEDGLPLTEIREELDEEGNVISSSLSRPGQGVDKVMETLKKAGVTEIQQDTPEIGKKDSKAREAASTQPQPKDTQQTPPEQPTKETTKKSVSFDPDIEIQEAPKSEAPQRTGPPPFGDAGFTDGTSIIELDENDDEIGRRPVLVPDESPEDAAMRQRMLNYHLNESRAIVAELQLEEGSEYDDEDEDVDLRDLSDYDSEYEDEDELEGEWGRSLKKEVSDDVHREMQELERRLNARMMENVGPKAQNANDAKLLVVRPDEDIKPADNTISNDTEDSSPMGHGEKKVRFAEDLDIASEKTSNVNGQLPLAEADEPRPSVFADSVMERNPLDSSNAAPPPKSKKQSRFKSARNASNVDNSDSQRSEPVPHAPGKTLADSIVERPSQPLAVTPPSAPGDDEIDPVLHRQEVAEEYYRLRNKMIQSQPGGFMPSELENEEPLYERKDGKVKKVSRFKAARIGGNIGQE